MIVGSIKEDILVEKRVSITPESAKSLFSLGLKLGSGEKRDKIGRKYSYFEEHELRNILLKEKFNHISHHKGEAIGLDGESANFIILLSHA